MKAHDQYTIWNTLTRRFYGGHFDGGRAVKRFDGVFDALKWSIDDMVLWAAKMTCR